MDNVCLRIFLRCGFLLDLGVGADYFVKTKTSGNGEGGLIFGVRAGYSFAPWGDSWTMPDLEISGGPTAGLNGPYIRLFMGGSRRRLR